jgi:hypothetical protein
MVPPPVGRSRGFRGRQSHPGHALLAHTKTLDGRAEDWTSRIRVVRGAVMLHADRYRQQTATVAAVLVHAATAKQTTYFTKHHIYFILIYTSDFDVQRTFIAK